MFPAPEAPRPRVAFFDFTGCEGCQLTVIDSLQTHPELLDVIEIVQFREGMSEKGDNYQVAFVEGCISRPSDEERLARIREQAEILVALGTCAYSGGVNAIRNIQNQEDVRRYVYEGAADWYETYHPRPLQAVVTVDAVVPGCPIDPDEFVSAVKALLQGRIPQVPDYPVCIECKLNETICIYQRGDICLGPISRAGCNAICPTYGRGCKGCRGLVGNANVEALRSVMAERGLSNHEIESRMTLFLTNQLLATDMLSALRPAISLAETWGFLGASGEELVAGNGKNATTTVKKEEANG